MAYNILIVDDSPAMRRMVKRVVTLSGVDIGQSFEAGNGVEALKVLRAEWIDLILSDINMPGMDGEELLLQVRKDTQLSSIPLVVISTDQTETRIQQMLAQGANGYISKPFMPSDLSDEMHRLLGGAPSEIC